MSSINKVFYNDDLVKYIFTFYPKRCSSCKYVMYRKYVDSSIHKYWDSVWKRTENKFCRGYCNWCCIYNFNHSY